MKFLIDAQLPRRLVKRFREAGFEAIHTLDLPLGNRTPDAEINDLSIREQYVVVTKDADFVSSFHLHRRPDKLLLAFNRQYQQCGIGGALRGQHREDLKSVLSA
jgi:predicted nuclease of predicted toxin-antitoxin system